MAKLLKLRRGSTSQHASFTGAEGEVTIDTTKDTAVVHDGAQAGGRPLAREDMSNVSSASIAGRLGTDSISVDKIAGGTLPNDVKVNSNNIINQQIINEDVSSSAGIAGTKISPNFGSQAIQTTGGCDTGNLTVTGQIVARKSQEPQIVLQDSDSGNTGTAAETGISFRDGGGTQQSMVGHHNSGDKDFYLDTAGADHRINFRVGGSTTQLEIESSAVNINGTTNITGGTVHLGTADTSSGHINAKEAMTFNIDSDNDDTNRSFKWYKDGSNGSGSQLLALDENGDLTVPGVLDVGAGIDVTGAILGDKAHFMDDGTSGPTLKIATDDQSPWAIQIRNDTYWNSDSNGWKCYQDNSGNFYQTVQGNGAFINHYFQTINGGTTNNAIQIDTNRAVTLYYQNAPRLATINSGVEVTGSINVSGTVDGRDVSADGSKLDGIESGATADQTDAEIANALKGETIGNASDGVHNLYCDDWFRNNAQSKGLYNSATAQHWYSEDSVYWTVAGGTNNGIKFRNGHGGTTRGAVYANSSNQIGFLTSSLNWGLKVDSSGNTELSGYLHVNSGDNSSDIYMNDADETTRRIHCNSNRIGFLRSNNNWGFYCDNDGNVTAANNVTAYSDARLKTNVNTINDALSIVGKLRGVSFDWKADGKHSIGVIAQEVEEVLPELVTTSEGVNPATQEIEEIKSVDYGKMVGVLINAINELKAEIEELKGGK